MDAIVSASSCLIRPSSLYQVRAIASSTFISTGSLSSSHIASSANNLLLLKSLRRTRTCSLQGSRPPMINCAGGIKEIGESEFSSTVLKSDRPVLVEFVATWCGPCRLIYPAMEALAQEYGDRLTIVKVDHDANPKLIEEYKVYGLPSFLLFKNGQEVPGSRREGAITKAKLKDYIENLLDTISVTELSSGRPAGKTDSNKLDELLSKGLS